MFFHAKANGEQQMAQTISMPLPQILKSSPRPLTWLEVGNLSGTLLSTS